MGRKLNVYRGEESPKEKGRKRKGLCSKNRDGSLSTRKTILDNNVEERRSTDGEGGVSSVQKPARHGVFVSR